MKTVTVMMPILIKYEWQWAMTKHAIELLSITTKYPFILQVVETQGYRARDDQRARAEIRAALGRDGDVLGYLFVPTKTAPNADCNTGLSLCVSDYIVYTGNDIFVRPGWLEALLEPFEKIPDCGASTLSSGDLHRGIPLQDRISEGIYGPFMMFPRLDDRGQPWRYDAETFPSQFGDTDLIMRIYARGKRMYRNWKVRIEHLNVQTHDPAENQADFTTAKERFSAKHRNSPLLIYQILTNGQII